MTVEITPLDFEVDGGFGQRARIGLVVLETDQTIEPEIQSLNLDDVAFYHARIPMEIDVSEQSLGAMLQNLPTAAGLLPADFGFDVIGYGCTSAATVIGADKVTEAIQQAHPGIACTEPISAAIAGFKALGAKRIAVVTPYVADVTQRIVDIFTENDLEVTSAGSFLEASDLVVARISEESIANAVKATVATSSCDAAFVSCTSLRSFEVIPKLEADLGIPVLSSNQAFLWRLLRLAGVQDDIPSLGALWQY